jgi:hypothetical protein
MDIKSARREFKLLLRTESGCIAVIFALMIVVTLAALAYEHFEAFIVLMLILIILAGSVLLARMVYGWLKSEGKEEPDA